MKAFRVSKSYAIAIDKIVVAVGNKQEMRRYQKTHGGVLYYSPGVKIGHKFS